MNTFFFNALMRDNLVNWIDTNDDDGSAYWSSLSDLILDAPLGSYPVGSDDEWERYEDMIGDPDTDLSTVPVNLLIAITYSFFVGRPPGA